MEISPGFYCCTIFKGFITKKERQCADRKALMKLNNNIRRYVVTSLGNKNIFFRFNQSCRGKCLSVYRSLKKKDVSPSIEKTSQALLNVESTFEISIVLLAKIGQLKKQKLFPLSKLNLEEGAEKSTGGENENASLKNEINFIVHKRRTEVVAYD